MEILIWGGFLALILALLALDLGVLNRRPHTPTTGEALGWTALWFTVAMLFGVGVYFMYETHFLGIGQTVGHAKTGWTAAVEYATGYLVELSLSMDNVFVIAVIMGYFRVPGPYQHRVLFWGILGVLVMRGTLIVVGLALLHYIEWLTYVFGLLLLAAAAKLLLAGDDPPHPDKNPLVRLARTFYPVSADFDQNRFFTRLSDGRSAMTPLMVALLLIESTDLLFAVDSIPAVFAITQDPFIVFTSNVFAILGLRSMYFALAGLIDRFHYVKYALVMLLIYIAVKMLLVHHVKIPTYVSLSVIITLLAGGIIVSLALSSRRQPKVEAAATPEH